MHNNQPQQSKNITFVDVRRKFDFRSIKIGRWVKPKERDNAAVSFYHALSALMTILNCPEEVISLRATLAFQYGIGGRLGVAAHYDPSSRCFSLAKNAGPGSIAHEWFHALDHYLSDKVFSDAPTSMFASMAWLKEATPVVHPLNDHFFQCLKTIMLDDSGSSSSQLFKASSKMDRKLQTEYYSRPEEMCARAFEAFIDDSPLKNRFLVSDTLRSDEAKAGLYPQGEQRRAVNQAFSVYFTLLGRALRQPAR